MLYSSVCDCYVFVFFFKQKTAYEMRISDWSSDVCSSNLARIVVGSATHVHDVVADLRTLDEADADNRQRLERLVARDREDPDARLVLVAAFRGQRDVDDELDAHDPALLVGIVVAAHVGVGIDVDVADRHHRTLYQKIGRAN